MEVETALLAAALEGRETLEAAGCPFWRGRVGGQDTVVSRTGIGQLDAALATAVGIQTFRPAAVINQGVAGAHREDLEVGDIVLGESCVPIHGLSMPVRGRGEGCDPFAWELRERTGETSRTVTPCPGDPEWLARLEAVPYSGGRKLRGRLGCGDVFNREYDRICWLRERAGEDCEDMESFAAYQVCRRFGVPFLGVRIISNNELTGAAYRPQVGEALQRFLLDALRQTRGQ